MSPHINTSTTDAVLGAVHGGDLTATHAVAARLTALHTAHEATHAVAWFEDERALADAAALDRSFAAGGTVGPLHGLAITVKDWIDVEGFPCAGESAAHLGRRPVEDATAVARLRHAGAVIVAKTVAWGPETGPGRVRHPVDPARTAGGSSTGEAVLVALGASLLGIGSDSGGSVRLPAAWCGVFGLKPTAGLVPTTGHFPRVGALSDGRTQVGPIGRTIDDVELVLGVIAGPDGRDPGAIPVPLRRSADARLDGARFAVVTAEPGWAPSGDVAAAVERAAGLLGIAGLTRVEWPAPWVADALDITRRYWTRIQLSGADVQRQLWDWDRFRRRYLEAAQRVDFLLTPVTIATAPVHRPVVGEDFVFTLPASLTGSPALTVPFGADRLGLPLAVQLIGRPWEDHRVLACARLLV